MNPFYTFIDFQEQQIYHRFFDGEKRCKEVISHHPLELYMEGKNRDSVGLKKEKLSRVKFNSFREANDFIRDKGKGKLYGQTSLVHQFIASKYKHAIEFDISKFVILNFDIEVGFNTETGYSNSAKAENEVISVTMKCFGKPEYIVLGLKPYRVVTNSNETYVYCKTEYELLKKFIEYWQLIEPDIITGWNIIAYDIPYIINRIRHVLGKTVANKLSPFYKQAKGVISEVLLDSKYGEEIGYKILGITAFDYIELYKKFSSKKLEKYSLDFVCHVELNSRKVDYAEYGDLDGLYNGLVTEVALKSESDSEVVTLGKYRKLIENELTERKIVLPLVKVYDCSNEHISILHPSEIQFLTDYELTEIFNSVDQKIQFIAFNRFIDYNKQDVSLPEELDNKLNFIYIALTFAFMAKVRLSEIFGQVRVWDCIVYNELLKDGIQIPPEVKREDNGEGYEGAFVKEPIPGLYKWLISVDLASLYPSIIMMYNLSYETAVGKAFKNLVDDLIAFKYDTSFLKEQNLTMTANGATFTKNKIGVMPRITKEMFQNRKKFKKMMLDTKKEIELIKAEMNARGIHYDK